MEESINGISLNLGCGKIKWDGWLGVDLVEQADVQADLKDLPFDDGYADRIAAIHVVEHFYRWEVEQVLKEWLRVLKPGGQLIIELPCMDKVFDYIAQCYQSKTPLSPTFSWFPLWGDPKYGDAAMCHKWGYSVAMIIEVLQKAGFENVKYSKAVYHFPDRDMRITAYKPC